MYMLIEISHFKFKCLLTLSFISDFDNLKIVNNIFIFEDVLIVLSRDV